MSLTTSLGKDLRGVKKRVGGLEDHVGGLDERLATVEKQMKHTKTLEDPGVGAATVIGLAERLVQSGGANEKSAEALALAAKAEATFAESQAMAAAALEMWRCST